MVLSPLSEPFTVADEVPFANCSGLDSMPSAASTEELAATKTHIINSRPMRTIMTVLPFDST